MFYTRREMFGLVGTGALAFGAGSALAQDAANPPPDVGRKFHPDGRVMPFAGNTVICHLPQQGPNAGPFEALLDVYRDLSARGFARKMALLPPSSYHMTVFGGANDKNRQPGLWPAEVPLNAPMADCDRWVGDQLRRIKLDAEPRFRMRVSKAEAPRPRGPIQIQLEAADRAEALKLRDLRERLAQALTIRAPDHDHYKFHVTLAYLVQWLTPEEEADYVAAQSDWRRRVRETNPIIELGAPEYCTFEDMFAFKTQFHLG